MSLIHIRGRGATHNPSSRFEPLHYDPDPLESAENPGTPTRVFVDTSRTIVTRNDSPDVGFSASVNPYRGCEHGCSYCYARPTHEYLGFSPGLDFESRILAKPDAPALLRDALASPRWTGEPLAMSGITDAYQPVERSLRITRGCLEVLAEFRNPVGIVTKNHLVTRDVDLLAELSAHGAAAVAISLTTLDHELQRRLEPRASTPARRLEAIRRLAEAGVPVRVMLAPVIPGLTDHEIPSLLEAAAAAGARGAAMIPLRLPGSVAGLFEGWLREHYPDRAEKVLGRVRQLRGGRLNDPRFGARMRGEGPYAEHLLNLFRAARRRAGLEEAWVPLTSTAFRRPGEASQLNLFPPGHAAGD
jgi:DNA repair photolyase